MSYLADLKTHWSATPSLNGLPLYKLLAFDQQAPFAVVTIESGEVSETTGPAYFIDHRFLVHVVDTDQNTCFEWSDKVIDALRRASLGSSYSLMMFNSYTAEANPEGSFHIALRFGVLENRTSSN